MKTKNILLHAMVCCFLFASSVVAQKTVEASPASLPSIMGSLDGRNYQNQLLKFELKLPDEGVILNRAEIDVYKNAGVDFLKNGNAQNDARIDAAVVKEKIILNYATKPIGSSGNSILVIGAVKQSVGITGPMVAAGTLKGLTATGKFELLKSLTGVEIGEMKADGLEGVLTTPSGAKIRERILILIRNGYSISFVLSGIDDDGINSAQDLLKGIIFLAK